MHILLGEFMYLADSVKLEKELRFRSQEDLELNSDAAKS